MSKTLLFYDLETSGFNSRSQRIMQFAAQRTDLDLNPVGQPVNVLIQLSPEILPDPGAILVHGIMPDKANQQGMKEYDFAKLLQVEVFTKDTIVAGFNNLRFDDEFIRQLMYRNFYDPYKWHYDDGRSRWDLMDLFRMTRALRPEGINFPFAEDGKPTNRLEPIAKANKLVHTNAHDALSDVLVTIDLARLLKKAQPKLYDWSFKHRDKKELAKLVNLSTPAPFVYTSGRYGSDHLKTSIVFPIAPDPNNSNGVLVYDLRFDPTEFVGLDEKALISRVFNRPRGDDVPARLPVKTLAYNRCPAVAPLETLDPASEKRIGLTKAQAMINLEKLIKAKHFGDLVRTVFEARPEYETIDDPEFTLYDSFIGDADKNLVDQVRNLDTTKLADFQPKFNDDRLGELLIRYKARNFPTALSSYEAKHWREYQKQRFIDGVPGQPGYEEYLKQLEKLEGVKPEILEQLKKYAQEAKGLISK